MITLRRLLESDDPGYDLTEMYSYEIDNTLEQFQSRKYKKQPWEVARYAKIKQVWSSFMRYGFVRNERELEDIESIFTSAFVKLGVNTMLSGHESEDPSEYFKEHGIKTEKRQNAFYDWIEYKGQLRISDFALKPMWDIFVKVRQAKTPEEKIVLLDQVLNIIHMRSNMAENFVEGGRKSLDDLSSAQEVKEYRMAHAKTQIVSEFSVEGFDLKAFLAMKSFAEKVRYANSKLEKLGVGSARIIYRIDDTTVLKLAKNAKGLAQNAVESDRLMNEWYGDIIAKVLEADDDDRWIVSEFAKKITPTRFKQIMGVSIEDLYKKLYMDTSHRRSFHFEIPPEVIETLDNSEFYHQLTDMIGNFDMSTGDFRRIGSFGEIDGRVVIRDYGLTNSVYSQYYDKSDKR